MFLWIGIVIGLLVLSAFSSGLTSAIFDFVAFLILLIMAVRRAIDAHPTEVNRRVSDESNRQSSGKIDIAP